MARKLNNKYPMFIIFLILSVIFLVILEINIKDKDKVCFEKTCFKVEKADSPDEREIGLMNRASMKENAGMIFIFDQEGTYSFWMKNTLIPLDMIWINSSNSVVHIYKNATPCGVECIPIIPPTNASYVLEINAGLADKYDINVGDDAIIY